MNTVSILLIKLLTCVIAFAIGLDLFYDATFADILSFSVVVTVISYFVGERFILPRFGQRAATLSDFILVYLSVWIFGSVLLNNYLQIAWGSIISATIIAGAEAFVHRIIVNRNPDYQTNERQFAGFSPKLAYSTEFAEEKEIPKQKKPTE